MRKGSLLLLSILFLGFFDSVIAQSGPGVPNIQRTKGELLSGPLAPEQGRTAVVAYHQGFIVTVPEAPGSAPGSDLLPRVWNFSDPRAPSSQVVAGMSANSGIAAHGYWQEGALLRSIGGGDFSVIDSNQDGQGEFVRVATPQNQQWYYPRNTGWVSRGLLFQPFQTQMWWSYGATNAPAVLYKRDQLLATWDHIGQTGVIGHPFLIGNILYFASDQSNTGIAAYDITPSLQNPGTPPRLLSVLRAPVGGYWPEIWGGAGKLLILFPARENAHFFVADVTDPQNMFVVADRHLPSGGDPSYAQFQDNFAFMDRYKIDMENNFQVDLTLDADNRGIDVSQFALPVGNLVFTGGYPHQTTSQGLAVWAHQAEPDRRGPSVGYHIPMAQQTNYPVAAPITLLIHETLRTETIVNGDTFIVRPIQQDGRPGAALSGRITFAFDDVLTFAPDTDLLPNSTYEVVLREGGIQDAVGNGMVGYSFRFSTGSGIANGNLPPVVDSFRASNYPVFPASTTTLLAVASDPNNDSLQYQFSFGDGTADTDWQVQPQTSHQYLSSGHFSAAVRVRDTSGATSYRRLQVTVLAPTSNPRGLQNSSIALDSSTGVRWVVNPDNDSVSRVSGENSNLSFLEIPLGGGCHPQSVTLDAFQRPWVSCFKSDELLVLSTQGQVLHRISLGYGSAPFAVLASPDGQQIYTTLYNRGTLERYSASSFAREGTLTLGPTPRALAITGDGSRALVTRHISPDSEGQIWDIALVGNMVLSRTIPLPVDSSTPDTASSGRGLPNYLSAISIHPSGDRAWITSKLDNVLRGLYLSGVDLNQENTVRAIVSEIDLRTNQEVRSSRRDIDNSDSPSSVEFSPLGDYAFIGLQGNNVVAVFDVLRAPASETEFVSVVARFGVERAPQGVLFDSTRNSLLVQNFLSRSLSVLNLQDFLRGESGNVETVVTPTIVRENLPESVIRGKRVFYNASDTGGPFGRNRMSGEGYISCATCHLDGGHDGRVWDFTGRGEGMRNTTDLRGRRGMGHGRVHWTGNFDEIQDFENDIRNAFGGAGFLTDDQFARTVDTLGPVKAGLSGELDDLSDYLSSLGKESYPRSPFRNGDGTHSDSAQRGAGVFDSLGCQSCHSAPNFTDSGFSDTDLKNVGTLSTSSGSRRGGNLSGIDTPTLLGLWSGAPYFHNGSAQTLESVFSSLSRTTLQAEDAELTGAAGSTGPTYGGVYREGRTVGFGGSGGSIRWNSVDGGPGGAGTVFLRYSAMYSTQTGTLSVNGSNISISLPRTANNPSWWPTDFRELAVPVNLQAGPNNRIEFIPNISYGSVPISIDEISLSYRGSPDRTEPHSRLLSRGAQEISDVVRYLRELDGQDDLTDEATPSPSPSPSPSTSPSPSPSPSSSPSVSPTGTPSVTPTPSPTASPTVTPTITPTPPTVTPTASATPTLTPTPDPGFQVYAPSLVRARMGRARSIRVSLPVRILNTGTPGRNVRFTSVLSSSPRPLVQSVRLSLRQSRRVTFSLRAVRRIEQDLLLITSGPRGQVRSLVHLSVY